MLFFVEGARIEGELAYEPLCSLEQRVMAHQYGLPFERWEKLRFLLEKALQEGIVDRVREEILTQFYGQGKLQLIADVDNLNLPKHQTNYSVALFDRAIRKQTTYELPRTQHLNILLHFKESNGRNSENPQTNDDSPRTR